MWVEMLKTRNFVVVIHACTIYMCSKELFFIIIIDKRIVYGHHKYQNHQNYTKPTKTSIKLVLIPRFRRNFPTLKKNPTMQFDKMNIVNISKGLKSDTTYTYEKLFPYLINSSL